MADEEKKTSSKAEAGKAPAKKAAAKKAVVKKAPAKKAAVKKEGVKKAPAKKAVVEKAPAKEKAVVKEAKQLQGKTVKVTLVKSPIGRLKSHKACLNGLGLRKIRQTVEVEDTPAVRGMINKVFYMVSISA